MPDDIMPSKAKRNEACLITEAAKRVGLSQKRIRDYESCGLVSPSRQPKTNNRLYSELDIERILRVKELIHEHGFTLACIRFLMASTPCWIIFRCNQAEVCPARQFGNKRCFEVIQKAMGPDGRTDCQRCPIYLNRHIKTMALLDKP